MNYLLRLFIVAFLFVLSTGISAQVNLKSGYVINLKGDTLFGLIHDGGGNRNAKVCVYKADKNSPIVNYLPGEIKSYRFIGDKYYSSQEVFINNEYKYAFTDVLLEGKLNLYHYRKNSEMAYYLEKQDGSLVGLLNKRAKVQFSSEELYGIQNPDKKIPANSERFGNQMNAEVYLDIYKDTLFFAFNESEKVRDQLDSITYTQKPLIKITKNYINEICYEGQSCINYEKDFSLFRPTFGLYSGIRLSSYAFTDTNVKSEMFTSVPVGVFCNFPMHRYNNGLSFQIEVLTNGFGKNLSFSDPSDTIVYMYLKSRTIGIPVSLRYQLNFNKFSPTIAIGKEIGWVVNSDVRIDEYSDMLLHRTQKGGWFYDIGLEYKLATHLSLFTTVRYQSFSNLVLDESRNNRPSYNLKYDNDFYLKEFRTNTFSLHVGIKF